MVEFFLCGMEIYSVSAYGTSRCLNSVHRGSGVTFCITPGFQRLVGGSCTLMLYSGTSGGSDLQLYGMFFTMTSFCSSSLSRVSGDVILLFYTSVVRVPCFV